MPNQVVWRWPDFKPEEVLSPLGLAMLENQGVLLYSPLMLTSLQQFRKQLQRPLLINHAGLQFRGYRSCSENKRVGGAEQSMHLLGIAADVTVQGLSVAELTAKAEASKLFSAIGSYPDMGFVHLDIRCTTDDVIRRW